MSAAPREVAPERAADFRQLLELTQALRKEVERGEWGVAAELETERRAVVERVFDVTPAACELPALTATLREVVRLNDELIGLAEHRRRAIARSVDTIAIGREARRTYAKMGTPLGMRP